VAIQRSASDHHREISRRLAFAAATAIAAITLITMGTGSVLAEEGDDIGHANTPSVTYNDFIPEERDLSDCISAIPKPGCGSEAKGGWRQMLVFSLVISGVGFIGWRIVAGARKNQPVSSLQTDGE
tara:strand:+ start:413 stop:790 length:378 start_codon:yes stop_codon:yes gene_type:complete